jgi:hypothetical protein
MDAKRLTYKPFAEIATAIRALDLESVKLRLMDPELGKGWTREYADSVEAAYKTYLTMVAKYQDDAEDILLAKDVDEFWHTHILQTMKYARDCEKTFGTFVHHDPHVGAVTQAVRDKRAKLAEKTRTLYEREFGGAGRAETAWTGRVQSDAAAMSNIAIRPRAAAMSNVAIHPNDAAMSNIAIRADGAAMSNVAIHAGAAAMSNVAIHSGAAAMSNVAIQASAAAMSNVAIHAGAAAMSNVAIHPDAAAMSNVAIHPDAAAMSNVAIHPDAAAMSNVAISAERAAMSNIALPRTESAASVSATSA